MILPQRQHSTMLRVIIKGKQGSGKSQLAAKLVVMLHGDGKSVSVQDGEETVVHQLREGGAAGRKIPVSVAIIVKQS